MPQAQARTGVEEWSFGSAVPSGDAAEQPGWDPVMVYDREGEPVRFSKTEISEARGTLFQGENHWAAK